MDRQSDAPAGTLVWLAPFWNRSGYGCAARTFVSALYHAGVRIRVLPVNEIEFGIDDCDLALMKLLETTPVVPPVTYIVSHVPSRNWLTVELPEPALRIMATTFDSSAQGNLPPTEWLEVFEQIDQIWLLTGKEREVFTKAGVPAEKIRVVFWPNPWLENPILAPPSLEPSAERFRFLSIAMFQPRRRWDVLIEAYFEEFKGNGDVELYLKVNYPPWHPVPGKPERDLRDLVDRLRQKTGSDAALVIDDKLGRRTDIVRLIDSCSMYISTDTTPTAPLSEAWARQRLVIIPEGLGYNIGTDGPYIGIAVDPNARYRLTGDMLQYQPHHKEAFMAGLHVRDVRNAMRRAYDMPETERRRKMSRATAWVLSPAAAAKGAIEAINAGWEYKRSLPARNRPRKPAIRIVWEGPQFSGDCRSSLNRELSRRLLDAGHEVSIISSDKDTESPASKILSATADVHVRNQSPPLFAPPPRGRWVMMQSWEYGRIPEYWVEPIASLVDEIWVPGRHVQKAFLASGVPSERLVVIPPGIDADLFCPVEERDRRKPEKFRFLFPGPPIWEKGIDILLNACRKAFTKSDGVALVIMDPAQHAISDDQDIYKAIRRTQNDPNAPEIIQYTGPVDAGRRRRLYNTCDCLVYPYRAEGFGLPVLEAMACGIPVIATAGGPADDFCPPGLFFPIPSVRREFVPPDLRLAGGAGWVLEPEEGALVSLLKEVYGDRTQAIAKAIAVSQHIRARYSWEQIFKLVSTRLQLLGTKPILRK